MLHIPFDNTYARELPGFYVGWKPATVPAPALLFLNRELAHDLGLDAVALADPEGAAFFGGNVLPEGDVQHAVAQRSGWDQRFAKHAVNAAVAIDRLRDAEVHRQAAQGVGVFTAQAGLLRSEEHTSELQSL